VKHVEKRHDEYSASSTFMPHDARMPMIPGGADSGDIATCIHVGVYASALTYGDRYRILASDSDKGHVRVRGDNGKVRWYPDYCFDMTGQPVAMLVQIDTDHPLNTPTVDVDVDVELTFSDGQQRWCTFTTPQVLSHLGGLQQFDGERLLSYDAPHLIVVTTISRAVIEQSLAFIQSQGKLTDSSKPFE
jgi:hypothetical protein